jgi:hypothetical protein
MIQIAPEILFHRYFPRLRKPHRNLNRGKVDLDRLPGEPLPVKVEATLIEQVKRGYRTD